jgi:acyl-CoA thioester hydrolase
MINNEITLEIPVRWVDMDAYQHMNSARYFDYTVEARFAWMATNTEVTKWAEENKLQFVMAKQSCDYLRPVVYPTTLLLIQKVVRVGNASIEFEYEFRGKHDPDNTCTRSYTKLVCFSPVLGRPIKFPAHIKALILG